ncbi:alpha-1,3-mannosyl-glycoprotein beta-1, 2-n-acetylglucosaminyltransferase, putative, partial [Perkinsus marinus ATCC 50983]
SYTFGEEGQSQGQYFAAHLSRIKLNTERIDFVANAPRLLHHVRNEELFDQWVINQMTTCVQVTLLTLDGELSSNEGKCFRIEYRDSMYHRFAGRFGLMPDEKEGIRRTAYKGVLIFHYKKHRIFLYDNWPSSLPLAFAKNVT